MDKIYLDRLPSYLSMLVGFMTPNHIGEIHNPSVGSVWLYLLPIISILGSIGNVISILILLRKPFKRNIIYAYFLSLSLTDFFYLLITTFMLFVAISK